MRPAERSLARLREAGLVDYANGYYTVTDGGRTATEAKVRDVIAGTVTTGPFKRRVYAA